MSALCIILARAGSKGLPGKNTLEVAGRPCVAWTIDDAHAAQSVGRVVLSSDGERALAIGAGLGAVTHRREPALAGDEATVADAVRDAAERFEGDPIVILYGNVPMRPAGLIDRAVQTLLETGADSVQSYAPVGKHHPWWLVRVDGDGGVVDPWEGGALNNGVHRRQDLPPAFVPDGGVIAVTRDALFGWVEGVEPGPHAFLGLDRRGVITGEGEVVDIDTETDRLVAEASLLERARSGGRSGMDRAGLGGAEVA